MTCPMCGGKTTVTHCRADCESVQRKRRCNECRHVFYSAEYESTPDRYRELEAEYKRRQYFKKAVKEAKHATG